jgi:hypothetical protein
MPTRTDERRIDLAVEGALMALIPELQWKGVPIDQLTMEEAIDCIKFQHKRVKRLIRIVEGLKR